MALDYRTAQPVIETENLYKSFGGRCVLEDVNLEIRPAEKLALIGMTGCGKTVLTKHFNGLLSPDRGKAISFGRDLSQVTAEQLEEVRRRIGYVFQGNALFSSSVARDVYDNVSLPLRKDPYDCPAANEAQIEAAVSEVLDKVGLGREFLHRAPGELSGGQKKRVAVARAIVANPPVIIYDEPTTGLDPEYTDIVIHLIESLHEASRNTTIAVTHEKRLMHRMGRVVFLRDGRIYFDGAYDELAHSEDPVLVRFLAEAREEAWLRA